MNPRDHNVCTEIAPLLVFYVCDEVNEQERASIEGHVAVCAACQAQLQDERQFHAALASAQVTRQQVDSTGMLLSQCRSELAEALDDLDRPAVKQKASPFGFLRHWMALHPAWSAATLLLLGLVTGVESTQWFTGQKNAAASDQAVNVRPGPRLTEEQLAKMAIADINLTSSSALGEKTVHVLLNAEQPLELTGNLDDSDVRNVLTYIVKSGDRFDSGVRLDCLDALRARAEDGKVRSALLCAARRDSNPAVRLKALEALRAATPDDSVREALLQALQHDSNPGVRVEAVNLLVRSLETPKKGSLPNLPPLLPEGAAGNIMQAGVTAIPSDGSVENVIRTLGDLQRTDPSRYVRLRSAAALREINARSDQ